MSNENPLAWLGRQKERKALKLCKNHMSKIVEVVEAMKDTFSSFNKNKENVKANSKKVFHKEREADEKKAEVLEELSKGNFPPLSREMIIRLVLATDDIGDNARAAAMKLSYLDPETLNNDVKKGLEKLTDLSCKSANLLEEAFSLLLENPQAAVDKTGEVEKAEEDADTFRAESLTPKIVEWADESQKPGTSYVLVEIEDNIEESIDQAENSADTIREIAIGSM